MHHILHPLHQCLHATNAALNQACLQSFLQQGNQTGSFFLPSKLCHCCTTSCAVQVFSAQLPVLRRFFLRNFLRRAGFFCATSCVFCALEVAMGLEVALGLEVAMEPKVAVGLEVAMLDVGSQKWMDAKSCLTSLLSCS